MQRQFCIVGKHLATLLFPMFSEQNEDCVFAERCMGLVWPDPFCLSKSPWDLVPACRQLNRLRDLASPHRSAELVLAMLTLLHALQCHELAIDIVTDA